MKYRMDAGQIQDNTDAGHRTDRSKAGEDR